MEHIYSLQQVLFAEKDTFVYAIVDGAGSDEVGINLLAYAPKSCCLFEDAQEQKLEDVAPHLVRLQQDEYFTKWLLENCYGKNMLVFIHSSLSLDMLATQLMPYTEMDLPKGNPYDVPWAYFAFYDPRILPDYLHSLNTKQATTFHSGINAWLCENVVNNNKLDFYQFDIKKAGTHFKTYILAEENTDAIA